uniref:Glutathione hydrolase proenzyme n=1 Tax=Thermosporothrix sp. COM3 TaxID=2490863 RepID=A0A455SNC8_9CHLR|nr:gamma-glutamyltransferase [Thermosporothrix sp. COM3]
MLSDSPVYATRGMVATAHYLATQAGVQLLAQGGNALDAALAANLAMTVVYPSTCSAGGDLFLLIWDAKTRQLHALNASGRAPRGLTPELCAARRLRKLPLRGPLSINVPGAVDGWFEAWERFGSASIEAIFSPAIQLAEEGMPVSPKLHTWFTEAAEGVLGPWSSSAEVYLTGGAPPAAGSILRQPRLARSYKMLAHEGPEVFYRGPLGQSITEYVQRCGGVLSMEDLAKHQSNWVEPIKTTYRGYEIYEFPPNSQGLTALEMLNILEGYDLASLGYQSPEYLHLLLEAKKLAFADRDRFISDPDVVEIPLERLLSKAYAAELRQRIDIQRASRSAGPPEPPGDTTYLCAADRYGNVVSLIQSLYYGFGSGVVGGDTGILLHNRGSYFSLDPRHANYLQPGKRTMHTLAPAMVLQNGQPYLAFGSMGGDAQPQIHVQLLTAVIDFQLNIQQAIAAPRWRSGRFQLDQSGKEYELGGQSGVDDYQDHSIIEAVELERRFPADVPTALDLRGHHVSVLGPYEDRMGHVQAIAIHPETHVFAGAADPRCDGLALGW